MTQNEKSYYHIEYTDSSQPMIPKEIIITEVSINSYSFFTFISFSTNLSVRYIWSGVYKTTIAI